MSVQATTWVWEHSTSEGTTRLVALALADAANAHGHRSCQANVTLARMVRTSERTVQRSLRWLEGAGEIVKTGYDPHYRTSIYAFPKMAAMGDKGVTHGGAPAMGDTPGAMGDNGGTDEGAMGDTQGRMGDTAMSPDPITPVTTYPSNPTDAAAPVDGDQPAALFLVASSLQPEQAKTAEEDPATVLARWWWERQSPKPAGKGAWFATLASIKAVLAAGWTPSQVGQALKVMAPPLTIPRLEIELRPKVDRHTNDRQHLFDAWEANVARLNHTTTEMKELGS